MSDLKQQLSNEEQNIIDQENVIKTIEKEFQSLFTCQNYNGSLVPHSQAHHSSYQIQISFNSYLKIPVQTSLFFTISLKNESVDFVSNISFFSNNSNSHNISDLVDFNIVTSPVLAHIEKINQKQILKLLNQLKTAMKSIETSKKSIINLKSEVMKEESKRELEQIFSIIKPNGSFCLDSFLANHLDISFVGEKPNRKETALIQEKIIEKIKETRSGRVYGRNPFVFRFVYFEIKEGKINFNDDKLEINYDGKKVYYSLGYHKLSKKKVNEFLANRFTYEGQKVTDLSKLGIDECNSYSAEEVKQLFSKEILQINVKEF